MLVCGPWWGNSTTHASLLYWRCSEKKGLFSISILCCTYAFATESSCSCSWRKRHCRMCLRAAPRRINNTYSSNLQNESNGKHRKVIDQNTPFNTNNSATFFLTHHRKHTCLFSGNVTKMDESYMIEVRLAFKKFRTGFESRYFAYLKKTQMTISGLKFILKGSLQSMCVLHEIQKVGHCMFGGEYCRTIRGLPIWKTKVDYTKHAFCNVSVCSALL